MTSAYQQLLDAATAEFRYDAKALGVSEDDEAIAVSFMAPLKVRIFLRSGLAMDTAGQGAWKLENIGYEGRRLTIGAEAIMIPNMNRQPQPSTDT